MYKYCKHLLYTVCAVDMHARQKRDAYGKTVGTKTLGGVLMVNIEWLDAPASTASTVIGQIQELKVTDFVKDYKIQQISYNMS